MDSTASDKIFEYTFTKTMFIRKVSFCRISCYKFNYLNLARHQIRGRIILTTESHIQLKIKNTTRKLKPRKLD